MSRLPILLALFAGVAIPHRAAAQDPAPPDSAPRPPQVPAWLSAFRLEGTLEGEARWLGHREPTAPVDGSVSDLYVRRFEVALTGTVPRAAEGVLVMATEYLGDDLTPGDGTIVLDEAHVTVGGQGYPLFLVMGERTQPFGLFDNPLVTDPMTQNAYEVKTVAVTGGYAGPLGTEVSATVYKGRPLLEQLFDSGLFDTTTVAAVPSDVTHVGSFIVSGTVAPAADVVTVFGSVASEPGAERRNVTLDAGFAVSVLEGSLTLDAEYARALQREVYAGLDRAYDEGALSASLSYALVAAPRRFRGSGNFRGRRSRLRAHPIEAAVRFEHFDDDGLSEQVGVWSVRERYGVGGRYTLSMVDGASLYVMAEYTHSVLRVPAPLAGTVAPTNDRITVQLGLAY